MSMDVAVKRQLKGFSLDVSFHADAGWLGILGASGCGKSMTLKCIAGIETPGSGRIAVNGRELYSSEKRIDIKPQRRKVGYLFQNYALFPNMRVAENIGCALARAPGRKQRVAEMIRRFQLEGLEDRYPAQLSGGQQQRVALARILAHDPDVLLLDEPFSALDSYLKEQLQAELMDLLHDYRGDVVMVTHSRDEVYRLCPRLLVMDGGRVVCAGDTREMFRQPRNLTVARLTGCKNYSRARVTGARTLVALDWGVSLTLLEPVPPDTDYIGVRAHAFLPAADGQTENVLPITVRERLESPFEWDIVFTVDGAPTPRHLWWMYPKGKYTDDMPARLTIQPKGILPLCSQGRELD